MQLDDAATILAYADFFEVCDTDQRRLLAFASERRLFARGDVVYRSGDVPDGAHVLVAGTLSAKADEDSAKPHEITEPGALLGAMALVIAKPRPVTITAITAAETLFVPRAAFMKLMQQSPGLAQRAADRIRRELGSYMGALEPLRQRMNKEQI
jgi:CRP-like cAMP-binding protein